MKKMKKIIASLLVAVALAFTVVGSVTDFKSDKGGVVVPMVDPPYN